MTKSCVGAFLFAFVIVAVFLGTGCATSAGRDPDAASCAPGETRACTCAGAQPVTGVQQCAGSEFGSCACTTAGEIAPRAPVCGDGTCNGTETCVGCPDDCGACPKCPAAPSCTDAVGVPASTTSRPDLVIDETTSTSSTAPKPEPPATGCQDAQLRMRLARITTHEGGATIYCVVNASDGVTSEVAISSKTKGLADGETNSFDPSVGVFWGQKSLHSTTNNVTITYNCFRVKSDAWAKVMKAGGDAAAQAGGYAGPYGWAFGVASVGANVAAAAIQASSGDELVFNSQQTIDKAKLLDLTNARGWFLRKKHDGGIFGYSWDWQLDIETWGCADGVTPPH